jgi:hypothetical protein
MLAEFQPNNNFFVDGDGRGRVSAAYLILRRSQTPTWPSADVLVVLPRLPNQLADPIYEGPRLFH